MLFAGGDCILLIAPPDPPPSTRFLSILRGLEIYRQRLINLLVLSLYILAASKDDGWLEKYDIYEL